MLSSDQKRAVYIVYREMPEIQEIEGLVDIVLTPQMYMLKKEPLPVKYAFQARRIAPSLFDETPSDANIRYFVFRQDDHWCFIAYDVDEVVSLLRRKGIDNGRIRRLYFAEQLAESFRIPLLLDGEVALATVEDTVVMVPSYLLDSEGEREKRLSLPAKGVSLDSERIPGSGSVWLGSGVAAVLLSAMWLYEGSRYTAAVDTYKDKLAHLAARYPDLHAGYTRRNIAKKYRDIDRKERAKRRFIQTVSTLVFRGVTLSHLHVDAKGYEALLRVADSDTKRKLMRLARRKGVHVTASADGVTLRGTW